MAVAALVAATSVAVEATEAATGRTYSLRSAAIGSVRAARRAGSRIASAATASSTIEMPASMRGSYGRVSESRLSSNRP